jgi:uncharacterized protein YxeA
MNKWFRFTIRDWFWLVLLFAAFFGWYSQRYSRDAEYLKLWEEYKQMSRKYQKQIMERDRQRELIEEEFASKNEAAINRELDLKTTVKALKLRLGEDPHGK